jgi:hypothetical protein
MNIFITEDLWEILSQIEDNTKSTGSYAIAWELGQIEGNKSLQNPLNIEELDFSWELSNFEILKVDSDNLEPIKIEKFLNQYFPKKFTEQDIKEFIADYNKIISDAEPDEQGTVKEDYLVPRPFKFEPLNVRDTFISLVTKTYPMGHEDEVVPFITPGLKKDKYGNYYTIIGNSDTAFTSHLDTASKDQKDVKLIGFEKDGDFFIKTNGKTILGADDKSGVTVMMYMIANNIPGVYWFFYGEERGGIGSKAVAQNIQDYPFMKGIKKMVSFDRRNYFSVITRQLGTECCSNEFALELCQQLGLGMKIDPTGVFTDSAMFIDEIPECTNVSVGYFSEHTGDEMQNVSYLERLAKACVSVDWQSLKVTRSLEEEPTNLPTKFLRLVKSLKKLDLHNKLKTVVENKKLIITLEIISPYLSEMQSDIDELLDTFYTSDLDPALNITDNIIKIELL